MSASGVRVTALEPVRAIEGGRLTLRGSGFPVDGPAPPQVLVGGTPARLAVFSSRTLVALVPPDLEGGRTPVRIEGVPGETAFVSIGRPVATGLHQVDSPVFDRSGRLYVTYSGTRGQTAPVSLFTATPDGTRTPFVSGLVNPTSMTIGPDGRLYVSSRYEGRVYRIQSDGTFESIAHDLGVACGIAFDTSGALYAGDRSGTIFRVTPDGRTEAFATLPPSVAAFHLAMGPDAHLYVTAPTLGSADPVYRIDRQGRVETLPHLFGRPQGLAFDAAGRLFVTEALAGSSGVYRVPLDGGAPELFVAGPAVIGLAFGPGGELAVASSDTVYLFPPDVSPG